MTTHGLSLVDRAAAYVRAFSQWPASWPLVVREAGGPVLYATWLLGQNYNNCSRYYGAYPPRYLERVAAFFPDVPPSRAHVLHVFAGALPPSLHYTRLDVNPSLQPDLCASVYDAPTITRARFPRGFDLVYADPPYSEADAAKYGTAMVDRRRALEALASVTAPGGHLVWLDVTWPMHKKTQWHTVGRITIIRSTNHRVRLVSIFERRES